MNTQTQLTTPFFQPVFGENWSSLDPVFRKHYANRPWTEDRHTAKGVMDIEVRGLFHLFKPFYRLIGMAPWVNAKGVPVTVDFVSSPNDGGFELQRLFQFHGDPYAFHSTMIPLQGNEVIEVMRNRFCWRVAFHWENGVVRLEHTGYCLKFGKRFLPLPIGWIAGRCDAEEAAVDGETFDMQAEVRHPLFGLLYRYAGRFKMLDPS